MKNNKIFAIVLGVICIAALLIGTCCLIFSDNIAVAGGVIVVVASIASGLILPNPISFWGLVAGILILFVPGNVIGIILMCIGAAGALANWLLRLKQIKGTA